VEKGADQGGRYPRQVDSGQAKASRIVCRRELARQEDRQAGGEAERGAVAGWLGVNASGLGSSLGLADWPGFRRMKCRVHAFVRSYVRFKVGWDGDGTGTMG
jgi:hypothetical protein